MWIITKLEIATNNVEIIDVYKDKIDAVDDLMIYVSKLSSENEVLIINNNRIEIYKRENGWIYGRNKILEYVYQLLYHEETQCVCSSEMFVRD
mgnify:CR=1 FL=1